MDQQSKRDNSQQQQQQQQPGLSSQHSASASASLSLSQQQQQQQQQQQDISFAFLCKVDNVRLVYTLLQTLLPKTPPGSSSSGTNLAGGSSSGNGSVIASMKITSKAIKVVVGTKSSQGVVLLESGLFQEYFFDSERAGPNGELQFGINLTILIDCLTLLTKDLAQFVALQIGYQGVGSKLCLMLEDGDVQCDCCLSTFDLQQYSIRSGLCGAPLSTSANDVLNSNSSSEIKQKNKIKYGACGGVGANTDIFSDFLSTEIVFTAEVASDFLKTIFASMDWESDTLQLYVSPVQPNFRMTTENKATSAVSEVEYSRTDDQFFTTFNCRRSQVWRYNARHIYGVFNALANATYTRIRINSVGALRMEHIINLDERNTGFAVFTILSNKTFLDSGGCDLYAAGDDDVDGGGVNGNGNGNDVDGDPAGEGAFGGNENDGIDKVMGDSFIRDVKSEMASDSNNPYGWSDDIKRSNQSTSPELK